MNLMLFLGSGVSLPTLSVGVKELTDLLMKENWVRGTDAVYRPASSGLGCYSDPSPLVQRMLGYLKLRADAYLASRGRGEATYEDLFFLAHQLTDEARGTTDNPAIHEFVLDVRAQFPQVNDEDFREIADEALVLIQCAVQRGLQASRPSVGLDPIAELATSTTVESLDIFTLNHDLLVESLLKGRRIQFADAFGQSEGDVRYFDPRAYEGQTRVRVFKLHGSIDWFRFREDAADEFSDRYGIQTGGNSMLCKTKSGGVLSTLDITPHFLTGTYNKVGAYAYGPIAEMHWWFHDALKRHTRIAMSGYGWNDAGINTRLMGWLYGSGDRRLCIMHRDPEGLRRSKSPLWHAYDRLLEKGRIVVIRKWLCDTQIGELLDALK